MGRLRFRTVSVTENQWRRIRRRIEPRAWGAGAGVPTLCAGVLAVLGMFAPGSAVNGVNVQGSRILVVEDTSGSMNSFTGELARQKSLLGNALFERSPKIDGFGVISTGAQSNLLHVLERELPARRGVDTVFVFSDFRPGTADWDCNDLAGLGEFRRLIRSAGVRLYLSTVNMLPSNGLIAIARESGGGLAGLAGAAASLDARRGMCNIDE
jgi:hypothetical protein